MGYKFDSHRYITRGVAAEIVLADDMLGISVLDHIIIAPNRQFYFMRARNIFDYPHPGLKDVNDQIMQCVRNSKKE